MIFQWTNRKFLRVKWNYSRFNWKYEDSKAFIGHDQFSSSSYTCLHMATKLHLARNGTHVAYLAQNIYLRTALIWRCRQRVRVRGLAKGFLCLDSPSVKPTVYHTHTHTYICKIGTSVMRRKCFIAQSPHIHLWVRLKNLTWNRIRTCQ